ncbi:MAG: ATP-binding protein [Chitinispirillaceae bacterium]|nr:ATP-binding protein [Chitinispirillaceae bacterium]
MKRLFDHFPVIVITGARQVGKTTLIEHCFSNKVKTITFDPVMDIANARTEPEYFLQNNPAPLFLDEIQYAPELLGPIKRHVDRQKSTGQYILSGSQNLSILSDVAESLAGRAAVINLMGLSFRELTGSLEKPSLLQRWLKEGTFTLDMLQNSTGPENFIRRAFRGGYPGTIDLPQDLLNDYWRSYLRTYIERDVRRTANPTNLQKFSRFIMLLAALSGHEINYAHLGRELAIDRNTAEAWTEIARATFQWYTIPAFSKNSIKRIAGKPKGFFADTGFLTYLLSISSPEGILTHPNHGALFETWVFLEVQKHLQEAGMPNALYHFRTYSGAEVDCVIEHNGRIFLIEIKATAQPGKKHTSGFRSFREYFPQETIAGELIICSVPEPLQLSETCFAVPWWEL